MKNILILSITLLISLGLSAQNFDKAKMDSLFARIDSNQKGMGSISIFKNGSEVYQNAFGYADIDKGLKANSETKYRIGSISKCFTAVIIMQLIEENKLSLNTKLSEFFPQISDADKITVEFLLRHRSGLYNFTDAPTYQNWMTKPKTEAELLKIIEDNGSIFKPNEKAQYSNTNYVLLSYIAEKIEKRSYADILNQRIINPLKLKRTNFGGTIHSEKNEALSYSKLNNWELSTETDMSIPMGAGSIVSTPHELNVFYNTWFSGKLVSTNSLNEMKKMQDNFGIGMFQIPFYDRKAFGHTGSIDGFMANAAYFPNDDVSFAYTANGISMPINDIIIGVLSIYFGKDYTLPVFKPGLELTSEDLDVYLGVYGSPTFPLKVTISKNGNVLFGQATGQPSFPLEAYEKDKFKFDQAMLKLEFIPAQKKMILRQGGGEFTLSLEK